MKIVSAPPSLYPSFDLYSLTLHTIHTLPTCPKPSRPVPAFLAFPLQSLTISHPRTVTPHISRHLSPFVCHIGLPFFAHPSSSENPSRIATTFLTKIQWTQDRSTSLTTIHAHTSQIYKASFSPHNPNLLSTIAADGHLKLWDLRQARSQNQDTPSTPAKDIIASPTEVLGMDWNKYDGHILGTTGKDQLVRIWDLRVGSGGAGGSGYVMGMKGHGLAVRKLEYVPFPLPWINVRCLMFNVRFRSSMSILCVDRQRS